MLPSTGLRDSFVPESFTDAYSNEVFDPLNWMFDGDIPLPMSLDEMSVGGTSF